MASMEKVSAELKLGELKKDSIRKTLETFQCQSSSLLLLTVQWRDLEDHFDSIQKSIEERSEEVELKEKRFDVIRNSIEDRSKEVESKEKHLELVRKSVEERFRELESKRTHFNWVRKRIDERAEEVESEENRLNLMQKSIKERAEELASKENQFVLAQQTVQESIQELELKEKKFELFQRSLEERSQDVELKEKQVNSVQKLVQECCEELELKKKKFEVFQRSVEERSEEVESKEKRLDLEVKLLNSIQMSITELSEELGLKEKQLNTIQISTKELSEELGSKQKQLESIQKLFEERSKDLELKKKQFNSIQKSIEECSRELKMKEKKMVSIQNSIEEGSNIIQSRVNSKLLEDLPVHDAMDCSLSADLQFCITMDGKGLQLFLNKHPNEHELLRNEVSTALQRSSDPAKLVLDAMQGFYPPHSKVGDVEFEASVIRRSCILLLEQLMSISPLINPHVKEEAMKLACEWRAKMRVETENSWEILGFLQLSATYGLASAFDVDYLQLLLGTVAQHRQAPELHRALGFVDKIPVNHNLHSQVKIEQPEHVPVNNPIGSSSANVWFCDTVDGMSMQLVLNDHLNEHELTDDEVFAALRMSIDPAKLVLDAMQVIYPLHSKKGGTDLESSAIRTCILLLEHLMRISPEIEHVKEEAMKLAVDWKAKMRAETENSLKVFVFLQLLATYGLISAFNGDEIFKILKTVAHHRQTPDLFRALGFADKIPGKKWFPILFLIDLRNGLSWDQFSPTEKRVSDFIKLLVEKRRWLEAIRYSYAFELVDKFPPLPLLEAQLKFCKKVGKKKYKRNFLSNEAVLAAEKEVATLRALIKCIADYKLESVCSAANLEKSVLRKKKRKANRTCTEKRFTAPTTVPQQQNENKHTRTLVSGSPQAAPNTSVGNASAVHSIQPPFLQPAGLFMNPGAKYSGTSAGQWNSIPPHIKSLRGSHALAAFPPINLHIKPLARPYGLGVANNAAARPYGFAGNLGVTGVAANLGARPCGVAGTSGANGLPPQQLQQQPLTHSKNTS